VVASCGGCVIECPRHGGGCIVVSLAHGVLVVSCFMVVLPSSCGGIVVVPSRRR
jgi:hypothetical protein